MTALAAPQRVDACLSRWAQVRASAPALSEGSELLTFGALEALVHRRSEEIDSMQAPWIMGVHNGDSTALRLVEFLSIVRSGRCAAVLDPLWPPGTRAEVSQALERIAARGAPAGRRAFYCGFTSGSTGVPKGYLRSHVSWIESFRACLDTFAPAAGGTVLAPGSICHSLSLFGMLLGLWSGAGVVVQRQFSATRALADLGQGSASCLLCVPSQLLLMLDHARRKAISDIAGVRLVLISGAQWVRHRTPELRRLFPEARIVEFYGTSETSFVSWQDAHESTPSGCVGKPFPGVDVKIRPCGEGAEVGAIFVRSPMLFDGYALQGDDQTAAWREGPWLSVNDLGRVDESGCLHLLGRQNRMIVTSGKNLFAEEVEEHLLAIPDVEAASVQARPDALRGAAVVAILKASAPFERRIQASALAAHCRLGLEPHKVPREFYIARSWPSTASGKTDHAALSRALQALAAEAGGERRAGGSDPCLRRLS